MIIDRKRNRKESVGDVREEGGERDMRRKGGKGTEDKFLRRREHV